MVETTIHNVESRNHIEMVTRLWLQDDEFGVLILSVCNMYKPSREHYIYICPEKIQYVTLEHVLQAQLLNIMPYMQPVTGSS